MFNAQDQPRGDLVPLRSAVFCLDCELISNPRSDECPACKSHSLLSLSRILRGSLRDSQSGRGLESGAFDITLRVELRHMRAKDVNATLGNLTDVIGPRLASGEASFHIDVRPILERSVQNAA